MENTGLKGEMKMNRYSDMLRVPAQYEGSQRGNPFSEAVPEMLSYEELMDRLVSKPLRPEGLDDMSSSERRTALTNLNNLFIPMDYMYAIYDTLYRAMLSSYSNLSLINMVAQQNDLFLGRQTKQFSTQAESCSILGVLGIGKTSPIRRCLHQIPQVIEHTEYRGEMLYCKQVLYLMVECPSDCSVKTLACSIFSALDQTIGSHYFEQFGKGGKLSVSAATTQIKILCMTHHIGLILVDEIQNAVTTAQKQHQVRPLVKFLVELTNDTSTGVCFIGTGLAEEIFAEQEHLRRRTRGLRLTPMKPGAGYHRFLSELWKNQYTEERAPLSESTANRIYDQSGGIPAYITAIFRESQAYALLVGKKCIDTDSIQYAVESLGLFVPKTFAKGVPISEISIKGDETPKIGCKPKTGVEKQACEETAVLTDASSVFGDSVCKRSYAVKRGRKPIPRDKEDILVAYENDEDVFEFLMRSGMAETVVD